MEKRRGILCRWGRGKLRGLAAPVALLALCAARSVPPVGTTDGATRVVRRIPVAVIADPELSHDSTWKIDMTRTVMDVNHYLRDEIGVHLKIERFDYLERGPDPVTAEGKGRTPPPAPRKRLQIYLTLPSVREAMGRDRILVVLVPKETEGPVDPGIADYLNGTVVLRYLGTGGGMTYVFLHEVCHLFGAIDLMEPGTMMSLSRPSFKFDEFTRSIMRANRDRSFHGGECPLEPAKLFEAIAIYRQRDVLALGEGQLKICIDTLCTFFAAKDR